jgi:hypothetical protein
MNLRLYGWSVLIAIGLMVVIGAIGSIPGCDNVMYVLLPGAFIAALAFPEGIHSSAGGAFLILAGALDALLLALLVMLCWRLIRHRSQHTVEKV